MDQLCTSEILRITVRFCRRRKWCFFLVIGFSNMYSYNNCSFAAGFNSTNLHAYPKTAAVEKHKALMEKNCEMATPKAAAKKTCKAKARKPPVKEIFLPGFRAPLPYLELPVVTCTNRINCPFSQQEFCKKIRGMAWNCHVAIVQGTNQCHKPGLVEDFRHSHHAEGPHNHIHPRCQGATLQRLGACRWGHGCPQGRQGKPLLVQLDPAQACVAGGLVPVHAQR